MMTQNMAVGTMRAHAAGAVPGAQVKVGGAAGAMADSMTAPENDLVRASLLAFPILLVALFFIFRGLRAALIPIIAALAAMAITFIALLGVTAVTSLAPYATDVVMLLGLGLAVDYSLLMVNRFREARATGASVADAVEHTGATAGRTVTFSALTVATALSGLFFFDDPTFTSVAMAGIATVLIAMAAALTLIPALLAAWGPKLGAKARQDAADGMFGKLARTVQARPALAALAVAGLLAAAALPYLHAHYGLGDPRTLPASSQARQVDQTLLTRFPEGMQADPIQVVARVPASDPAIGAYAASLAHQPGVAAVNVEHGLRGNVSVIDVAPAGSTQGSTAEHLVGVLRDHRPQFTTYVTGSAASLADFKAEISSRIPCAVAWIALATFALLFLMTGSVLIPVKALAMNILSLGATFGALVWVFQDGHLASLLGFTAFGAIEAWAPVIIFTFAFGLSMDYEVFLLSRIKESHDEGNTTNDAVAHGLQRSGRIITSAALLIVFLGFAAGQTLGIKEMGLALAIAVAVDATLIRCVLVPATMTLLGPANWWAPAPLRRLYQRIGLHEASALPASGPGLPAAAIIPHGSAGRELEGSGARR
jgi:RND superfamily putative drug exporter